MNKVITLKPNIKKIFYSGARTQHSHKKARNFTSQVTVRPSVRPPHTCKQISNKDKLKTAKIITHPPKNVTWPSSGFRCKSYLVDCTWKPMKIFTLVGGITLTPMTWKQFAFISRRKCLRICDRRSSLPCLTSWNSIRDVLKFESLLGQPWLKCVNFTNLCCGFLYHRSHYNIGSCAIVRWFKNRFYNYSHVDECLCFLFVD